MVNRAIPEKFVQTMATSRCVSIREGSTDLIIDCESDVESNSTFTQFQSFNSKNLIPEFLLFLSILLVAMAICALITVPVVLVSESNPM